MPSLRSVEPRRAERRSRVDYRMQRRMLLQEVAAGHKGRDDVTDAHPDLVRAAGHLGTPVDEPCPLCGGQMVEVTYGFDLDRVRHPGGRAMTAATIDAELARWGELTLYLVEVCRTCRWHHLLESVVLVDGGDASGGRAPTSGAGAPARGQRVDRRSTTTSSP